MPNAYWLSRERFCWQPDVAVENVRVVLHHDVNASMFVTADGVVGGEEIELAFRAEGLDARTTARFPHLAGLPTFTTFLRIDEARELASHQLALAAYADGRLVDYASVQIAGAIDDLFAYDGPLGVTFDGGAPTLRLWAPTARRVRLLLFEQSSDAAAGSIVELSRDRERGVWSANLTAAENDRFYLYEVTVYASYSGRIETNLVTDPYSVSVGRNSTKSQIVDVSDAELQPDGWQELVTPPLETSDVVVYELHVRDFSSGDESVPAELRGRYAAFGIESDGTRHLQRLAGAGVTHLHLLPINDFATADDDTREYNWGYDPLHWLVPEGSYAHDADGSARIREVREMIAAIKRLGLRVVLDVVFNHTFASGDDDLSVLDRIVPGYYHRLDENGVVTNSTCCSNTASEHAMMERLMLDALLFWARQYKIDGFRFDLMGHHLERNMLRVRDALQTLTPERDGVDGVSLLLYGEGWDFGEMAHETRGRNATQASMAGSGIATFNDRLRDAVRGGSPFGDIAIRGFCTGAADEPGDLNDTQFRIGVGLAGGLRELVVRTHGRELRASERQVGYATSPLDVINYVSAHDNETLWDVLQLKAPTHWSIEDRVRMHNLATSIVALGNGIPFFHAGDEILRSKSGDRNSFKSGDLFNRIDWSMRTSNWGVQLPPRKDNEAAWPLLQRLFDDANTQAMPEHRQRALDHFVEMLAVRRSSSLFRQTDTGALLASVTFDIDVHGVIAMRLRGEAEEMLVVFNARPDAFDMKVGDALPDLPLHPVLQQSSDAIVRDASLHGGRLYVPARTTAVFSSPLPGGERG